MVFKLLAFCSTQDYIEGIRSAYTKSFTSKDMARRQIAVATYLIDRLALRAGNEKVGFTSLKFKINLYF